jgi:hypothetical protein
MKSIFDERDSLSSKIEEELRYLVGKAISDKNNGKMVTIEILTVNGQSHNILFTPKSYWDVSFYKDGVMFYRGFERMFFYYSSIRVLSCV